MKKLLQIRFVKALTITIFIFIQILDAAYAQEKQKACLAPMGALGDISEMQKQIIFNSLQESLSTQYVLASQKAFEAAQTQAFDELEYDECTEDQCFALIQQILQVDNLFLFNMTREGNFTQLSLTRVDLDSQRLVRTAFCEDCNIKQLNNNVDELGDMLTLAGLGWETYLLLTDDSEETAVNDRNSSLPFIPRLAFKTHSSDTQTVLLWKWRF